ncbi:MAG: type II toxin-antitoxin system RelE/ParE family toxin [Aggregatilineales bacterium]
MPTTVSASDRFQTEFKRLARKYPAVTQQVGVLIGKLENDQRPGDKIPHVGYDVYKVRVANPSAARGKRGGFRVIYYVQLIDSVVLVTIYAKTEKFDVSPDDIRSELDALPPNDTPSDSA